MTCFKRVLRDSKGSRALALLPSRPLDSECYEMNPRDGEQENHFSMVSTSPDLDLYLNEMPELG